MRKSTCSKMALNRQADQFLSLLSSQLAGSDYACLQKDDILLQELLEEGLTAIPASSPLKLHLQQNISTCVVQLKNLLETSQATQDKPVVTGCCTEPVVTGCCTKPVVIYTAVTIESIEASLKHIKDKTDSLQDGVDIHVQYRTLLLSCVSNDGMGFRTALKHWAEFMVSKSSIELSDAVQFCSNSLMRSYNVLECLEFFVYSFSSLILRTTPPHLSDVLLSILFSIYFLYENVKPLSRDRKRFYDNHLAALLSIYIELCLSKADGKTESHLRKVLQTFSGKEKGISLNAMLQVDLQCEERKSILIPVIKSTLYSCRRFDDPQVYICAVCCFNLVKRQHSQVEAVFHKLRNLIVPDTLNQWLMNTRYNICERLGLKKGWSCDRIHDYFLSGLTETQEDLLLDFIREESGANTEEKELPLSPEEGSATPYLVGDEDERNDSYDEEDERSASCAFFLDNEGFIVTKRDTERDGLNNEEEGIDLINPTIIQEVNSDFALKHQMQKVDDPLPVTMETYTLPAQEDGETESTTEFAQSVTDVVMETVATPITKKVTSSARKRKSLLRKLRNSLTPPTSKPKFSPRLLRSAVKKRNLMLT